MASTTSMQTGRFNFMGILPELRLMVRSELNDEDFNSLRLTSRRLLEESGQEFVDKFLTDIDIVGTVAKVKALDEVLRSPNIKHLTSKINKLHVRAPTLSDLPLSQDGYLCDSLPTKKRVLRLLRAMPALEWYTLGPKEHGDRNDDDVVQFRGEDALLKTSQAIETIFLPALVRLNPEASNLTCLSLDEFGIDGRLLVQVLSTHRSSLRMVCFTSCQLTGFRRHRVTWDTIFSTLLTMNLEEVFLSGNVGIRGEVVLCARSDGNTFELEWSSSNPMSRMRPVDFSRPHLNFIDYNEVADADYYACFSRTSASLHRDWVRKGLEILLGLANYTLYWDPCDGIGFPGKYIC
jgi:hypothetical protein